MSDFVTKILTFVYLKNQKVLPEKPKNQNHVKIWPYQTKFMTNLDIIW